MDLKSVIGRRRLYWIGVAVLTLLTLILRALALTLTFDAEIGYFTDRALPVVVHALEAITLIGCFAPLLLFGKEDLPVDRTPLSTVGRVAACITAICFVATAIYLLPNLTALPAPTILVLLAVAFLIVGACYFLLQARGQASTAALCGYGVIFAAVLLLSVTYFDRYTQMNAPHKVSLHLAMLSIMVCMLFEIRTLIGCPKPRGLAVTSAICFFCTAVYGGSNLIAFVVGTYANALYLMGDLVSLGFAVYLACRTVGDLLPAKTEPKQNAAETEENV